MSWDGGDTGGAAWNNDASCTRNGNERAQDNNEHAFTDQGPVSQDDFGGAGDGTCRNCGGEGHISRDCQPEKKMTGECFNCGEIGHNKADCTNPKVERAFTGTCHVCNEQGHRAAECPQATAQKCKNCQKEGHRAAECTQNRALDHSDVPDMSIEEAWAMMQKANAERDIDDFKMAVKIYSKVNPEMSFDQLETKFRAANFDVYLIAMEKEVQKSITLVNLQGKSECKFAVSYQFSPKPQRPKYAEGWPPTPEENLERLKDAGVPMEHILPLCRNCNELGHISKSCPQDKMEIDRIGIKCTNCNEAGHRMRDCPMPRYDPNQCKNCKQSGHKAADCTEPRSAEGVECRKCNEIGHFASDCPNAPTRGCRNCGEEGHMSKECDKPRNPDSVICRNCDQMGHTIKRCKQAVPQDNDLRAETDTHNEPSAFANDGWASSTEVVDGGW